MVNDLPVADLHQATRTLHDPGIVGGKDARDTLDRAVMAWIGLVTSSPLPGSHSEQGAYPLKKLGADSQVPQRRKKCLCAILGGDRPLVKPKGHDDRLQWTAVRQEREHERHGFGWRPQAVERRPFRDGEGLVYST